jgi:hypothetical protein
MYVCLCFLPYIHTYMIHIHADGKNELVDGVTSKRLLMQRRRRQRPSKRSLGTK